MEKFSKFSDARTGVNPFTVQPYAPPVVALLLGGALALLRLPLLAVLGGLLLACDALATSVPAVAGPVRATAVRALSRAVLLVIGVWTLDQVFVSRQAVRIRPSKASPRSAVRGVDVIVANRCSPLDVLVLAATYAPTFTATSLQGGLVEVSLLSALVASFTGSPAALPGAGTAASVGALLSRRRAALLPRPLAVFPEGAPTNNRAILSFGPIAAELAAAVSAAGGAAGGPRTHVVALRYATGSPGWGSFSPVFVTGAPGALAAALLAQASVGVTLLRLPDGFDPQPGDFNNVAEGPTARPAAGAAGAGAAAAAAGDAGAEPTTWPAAVRDALAQLLRGSRAVTLDARDYDEFVRFYAQWRRGMARAS